MANPAVIKAAAALLSDERTRKGIGWIVAAILSPLIVLLALLCALSAGSDHNVSVIELCFNGGALPPDTPAEYVAYIEDMRSSFAQLSAPKYRAKKTPWPGYRQGFFPSLHFH